MFFFLFALDAMVFIVGFALGALCALIGLHNGLALFAQAYSRSLRGENADELFERVMLSAVESGGATVARHLVGGRVTAARFAACRPRRGGSPSRRGCSPSLTDSSESARDARPVLGGLALAAEK